MSLLSLHAHSAFAPGAAPRRSFFARFIEALQVARMRRAQEVVASYHHLLPNELESFGNTLDARSEDYLPFGR